jgi:PAS domain S-box-containing protein
MTLAERLARLGDILIKLSGSPIPTHLFQTLGDHANEALPNDYLALCLKDVDENGYRVHLLAGAGVPGMAARVFGPSEGLPGLSMSAGHPSVVDDLTAAPENVPDLEGAMAASGLRAALTVPVRRGLEIQGALVFASRSASAYGPDDVQIAGLMAAGLSSALESSRVYQVLADEQNIFQAVLGSTGDAVLVVNLEGFVIMANPAVQPVLGLTPEQIIGRPLHDAVDDTPLRALFEQGRPGTVELALPGGRTAQVDLVAVTSGFNEPIGLTAIVRDVTLRKTLEEMKNDFVNTVSHDLKNPIAVIEGMTTLLQRELPAAGRERERCDTILRTTRFMAELVTDLLDLGKIEAGFDPNVEPLDVVPAVHDTVKQLAIQAEAKRIDVKLELPDEVYVMATPGRLKQALLNLVSNAIKYTPDDGHVNVSVSAGTLPSGAEIVSIRVKDTGHGIPARDLPHVFDKFFRVRNDATEGVAGTGLGLAITKSIVEAYTGRIRAESVEGVGSTFTIELPRCGAYDDPPAATTQRSGPPGRTAPNG